MNGIDHKFVNLDLDPLDFKSSKPFLKKPFTALKNGFRFVRCCVYRNANSVLDKKKNLFLDWPKGTHPHKVWLIAKLYLNLNNGIKRTYKNWENTRRGELTKN